MCESVFNLSLLKGNQASSYLMKFPRWCCQPTIFTPLNIHHIHSQSYQTCSEAVNVPPSCCQSELQLLQVPEERPLLLAQNFGAVTGSSSGMYLAKNHTFALRFQFSLASPQLTDDT